MMLKFFIQRISLEPANAGKVCGGYIEVLLKTAYGMEMEIHEYGAFLN
jgi:hypothetical protein